MYSLHRSWLQLQSSCPRQADPRFRSTPRFPCETTHALQQHQNRPYKILILQELVLIILEFVDACLNEIIRFIGAGRHLIPSNINRFFVVSQNHHILVNIITALLCCRNVGLVENRSIMDGIRTICRRWSERDSRTPDTTDDPARNRFRLWPQSQLTSEILLDFLIDVALPGSIGAMNRYGAQTQHHAPPVSDMPHETAETQRNQQKGGTNVPPDGGSI